ncbi:MAG: hypothetical protein ABI790_01270 [Betaproteobacteria bacterium]
MKTEFTLNIRSNKDNIASATILAVCLFALASGALTSSPAAANHATEVAVQVLDPIVVTASRGPDATLDTIVVSASRKTQRA